MENIKVGVRLRPMTPLELEKGDSLAWEVRAASGLHDSSHALLIALFPLSDSI